MMNMHEGRRGRVPQDEMANFWLNIGPFRMNVRLNPIDSEKHGTLQQQQWRRRRRTALKDEKNKPRLKAEGRE